MPKLTDFERGTIVRVIKPFDADRTPCPQKGTVGIVYRVDDDGFICVAFFLPMWDTRGNEWLSQGNNSIFMRLRFFPDELEIVDVL
jgi:hypothetical protein